MTLNPEIKLLFLLSMNTHHDSQDILQMKEGWEKVIDRHEFIALVRKHKLSGPVHQTVAAHFRDDIPEHIQKNLKSQYVANVRKALRNTAEAIKLSTRFNEHGIEHLFLKGLCLSQRLYGDTGFRHAGDIDVIVADENIQQAMHILESMDYVQVQIQKPLTKDNFKKLKGICHHVKYMSPQTGVAAELHWRFYKIDRVFPVSFDRAVKYKKYIRVQGKDLPVLCDHHALMFLCVHGAKHAWECWVWLKDIHDFFFLSKELDKDRFFREARQMLLIRPVAEAFLLMNKLHGVEIPDQISGYTQSDYHLKKSVERILRLNQCKTDVRSILLSYYHKMFAFEGMRHSLLYIKNIISTKWSKKDFNPDHPSRLLGFIKRGLW